MDTLPHYLQPQPREARLPVWAFGTLELLRTKLRETLVALQEEREAPPSRVRRVTYGVRGETEVSLPDTEAIRVYLKDDPKSGAGVLGMGYVDIRLMEEKGKRFLQVMSDYGAPMVSPQSGNVLRLHLDDDWR